MSESVETGSTSPNIVAQTRRAAGGGGSVQAAAPGRGWSSWRQTTVPGVWGALVFACLSFTPSLLPRSGLIQGIVAGVTAAIGYGLAWVRGLGLARVRRPGRRARRGDRTPGASSLPSPVSRWSPRSC